MASSSLSSSPGPSSSSLVASLTYPLTACLPGHQRSAAEPSSSFPALFGRRHAAYQSRGGGRDDFASLLHRSSLGGAGTDTDTDSETDAISLLSGIAARSPSASTAARARAVERARQRRREQRARQAGLWGLGDWASGLLACGLFGRPKSGRHRQGMGDERGDRDRGRDTGLREPLLEDEGPEAEEEEAQLRDPEPESGDEDARSLPEEALDARIVASSQDRPDQGLFQAKNETLTDQAAEDDVAAAQAAEEAALAAEEEQAVLDAQRKAARKAAREGLLAREATRVPPTISQAEIEAEAEAAAGGFDVDEDAGPLHGGRAEESHRNGFYDVDEGGREQEPSEADGSYYDEENSQPAVVHHHHYYDYHPSEQERADPLSYTASMNISTLQPEEDETLQDGPDEEDEADMAGLGLGPRRKSAYSTNRGSQGKGRSRDGSSATGRDGLQQYPGLGSGSGSGSGSGTGSAALSRRSGEKHYQYAAAAAVSGAGRESSGRMRRRRGSAGPPSLASSSNSAARRYQLPPPAAKADDSAADAAAGGFDDFEVPPSALGGEEEQTEEEEEEEEASAQEDAWGSPSSHFSPRKMSYRERRYVGSEEVSVSRGGTAGSSDGGRSSGGRSGRSRRERRATAMDNGLDEADGL